MRKRFSDPHDLFGGNLGQLRVRQPVVLGEKRCSLAEESIGTLLASVCIYKVALHSDGEHEIAVDHLVVTAGRTRVNSLLFVQPSRVVTNNLFVTHCAIIAVDSLDDSSDDSFNSGFAEDRLHQEQ